MKPKNTCFPRFAVTVSPVSGKVSPQQLVDSIVAYLESQKKKIVRSAYVYETGKEGNHPHLHFLVTYSSDKRRDTLLKSLQTFFSKNLSHPITKPFIDVKPAYNPEYFLTEYMSKENPIVNNGYDITKLKKEQQSDKRKYLKMGTQLKPITRSNILEIIQEWKQTLTEEQVIDNRCIKSEFDNFVNYMIEHNFNVSFIIWNKKQIIDCLKVSCGESIFPEI